jgi:hypothetical protein
VWRQLPDVVTIYRGTRRPNDLGLSWSLDRDIAAGFPFKRLHYGGSPMLITATVPRAKILAVRLDRDEAEAIVPRGRRVVSRDVLSEPEPRP